MRFFPPVVRFIIKTMICHVVKVLDEGQASGRTLDFLCQELFREINTTGSKANDSEITRLVIAFKAGLEAAREQIQNVE